MLGDAGIAFAVNPRLVRGLDYYNRTVFEWVAPSGDSARRARSPAAAATTACSRILGGKPQLRLRLRDRRRAHDPAPAGGGHRGSGGSRSRTSCTRAADAGPLARSVGETLRDAGMRVVVNAGGGSFKSQMKKADASGACLRSSSATTRRRPARSRSSRCGRAANKSPCRRSAGRASGARRGIEHQRRRTEAWQSTISKNRTSSTTSRRGGSAGASHHAVVVVAAVVSRRLAGLALVDRQAGRGSRRAVRRGHAGRARQGLAEGEGRGRATRPTSTPRSGYAPRAALFLAKMQFDAGDTAAARAQLQWVVDSRRRGGTPGSRALPPRRDAAQRQAVRRGAQDARRQARRGVRRAVRGPSRRRACRAGPHRRRARAYQAALAKLDASRVPQLRAGEARRARRGPGRASGACGRAASAGRPPAASPAPGLPSRRHLRRPRNDDGAAPPPQRRAGARGHAVLPPAVRRSRIHPAIPARRSSGCRLEEAESAAELKAPRRP